MAVNYTRLRDDVASRLIQEYGTTVTLRQFTEGAYNTATQRITRTSTDVSIFAVDMTDSEEVAKEGLLTKKEKLLYVDPSGTEPVQGDQIVIDDIAYEIIRVEKLSPAGTVLLYEVYLNG